MKRKALTAEQQRVRIAELAVMKDVRINKQVNSSIPAILKKIRHCRVRCEDCPSTVKNRMVVASVVFWPVRHWIQKCNTCEHFLNIKTGRYEYTWQQAHSASLVKMGYYRQKSTTTELTEHQRKELKLYRNQLQSVRAQEQMSYKKSRKSKDFKQSE